MKGAQIEVFDTHAYMLSEFIRRRNLQDYFDSTSWQAYEISVDVTAFVKSEKSKGLVFIECKIRPINLADFSQLLGYSRVALPLASYLISPGGVSGALKSLVLTHDRADILDYQWSHGSLAKKIILAKWNVRTNSIDFSSVVPSGYMFV
jgi:hypothetical protein